MAVLTKSQIELLISNGQTVLLRNGDIWTIIDSLGEIPTSDAEIEEGVETLSISQLLNANALMGKQIDGPAQDGKSLAYNAITNRMEWQTGSGGGGLTDPGSNGLLVRTALNTTISRTIVGTSNRITVTNGDGVLGTPTLDIGSDVATLTGSQTLTNKTLTSPIINLGSDATGDIYYRNSSGNFARLGIGTNAQVLTVSSGIPSWQTGGGSGTINDGLAGKIAYYPTDGTTIDDLLEFSWDNGNDLLALDGNFRATKHAAIGAQSAINGGSIYPYPSGAALLDIQESINGDFSTNFANGIIVAVDADPITNLSQFYGINVLLNVKPENTQSGTSVSGLTFLVQNGSGGANQNLSGLQGITLWAGSDSASQVTGGDFQSVAFSGMVDTMISLNCAGQVFSNVNDFMAIRAGLTYVAGTLVNAYGLKVEDIAGGTNNWAIRTGLGKVELGDRLFATAPDSAPADGDLSNSAFSFYLDESADKIKVKVKYSTSALKLGEIPLSLSGGNVLNIGTTTITSGSTGRILYEALGNVLGEIPGSNSTSGGVVTFAPSPRTSGSAPWFSLTTPADTALAADIEAPGIYIGGNGSGASVVRQFTAGGSTFPQQREYVFSAPTYAFTSSDTITTAATVAITNAPLSGSNAILTNKYALWVQAGQATFNDPVGQTLEDPFVFIGVPESNFTATQIDSFKYSGLQVAIKNSTNSALVSAAAAFTNVSNSANDSLWGTFTSVWGEQIGGTTERITGAQIQGSANWESGTANITSVYGVASYASAGNSGNVVNMLGVAAINENDKSSGTVTNSAALFGDVYRTNGALTNAYGLWIQDIATTAAGATNIYAIKTEGSAISQFGGRVHTTASTTSAALRVGSVSGDPSALSNGDIWYNSTGNKFRCRENGVSIDFNPPFDDQTTALVKGSVDATKLLRFEVDGFTTGTTRVLTPQNASYTIAGTDLAETFTATQTFNSGILAATRPKFITSIDDINGNEIFAITATASAVNEFTVANAATGNSPTLSITGGDTNAGGTFSPKGTGTLLFSNATTSTNPIARFDRSLANGAAGAGILINGNASGGASGTDGRWLLGYFDNGGGFLYPAMWGGVNTASPSSSNFFLQYDSSVPDVVFNGPATTGTITFRTNNAFSTPAIQVLSSTNGQTVGINTASGTVSAQLHAASGSTSRVGLRVDSASNSSADLGQFNVNSSNTNQAHTVFRINVNSNGTAAAGLGGNLVFGLETSGTGAADSQDATYIRSVWTDSNHPTRTADIAFANVNNASALTETFRIRGNGQVKYYGLVRSTSDLTKTSSTTFSDITGLTVNLVTGRTYKVRVCVFYNMTSSTGGGAKITLTGTATASAALGAGWAFDTQSNGDAIAGSSTRLTAINGTTPIAFVLSTTDSAGGTMWGEATIVCNGSGNLRVQGAQATSDSDSTTFLTNSTMEVWEVSN